MGSSIRPLVACAPESESVAVAGTVAPVAEADDAFDGAVVGDVFVVSSPHPTTHAAAIVINRNGRFMSLRCPWARVPKLKLQDLPILDLDRLLCPGDLEEVVAHGQRDVAAAEAAV